MKKFFFAILTLCLGLGISGNVSAATLSTSPDEDENITWEVIEEPIEDGHVAPEETFGLSDEDPFSGIVPFGTSRPSSVWNIATKGQYDFAGSTGGQTLYTNYKFKGKTSYSIKVNNTGSNPITVKAKRLTKTYASTKISGGKSATIEFSNIQKDTEFYITFDGSGIKFDGFIK